MKTLREAVELYVDKLNEFPLDMIEQMMEDHPNDWWEVTEVEDGEDFFTQLPMWGYMWQFSDGCDHHWMEEEDGISVMSKLGFRIYEHREWGYFFGIDSAGHDFYDAYWTPLYKERGIQWHSANLEAIDNAIAVVNDAYGKWPLHIDIYGDGKYQINMNTMVNADENGDCQDTLFICSDIRDDKSVSEIIEVLELEFESYDLEHNGISKEEAAILRKTFYECITELKKELGI